MLQQLLSNLTGMAVMGLVVYTFYRWRKNTAPTAAPTLPQEGARISTSQLRTFPKGKSVTWSLGNQQSMGYIELTPTAIKTGRLIAVEAGFDDIERVQLQPYALSSRLIFEFRDRDRALAVTLGRAEALSLLNYLRDHDVSVEE